MWGSFTVWSQQNNKISIKGTETKPVKWSFYILHCSSVILAPFQLPIRITLNYSLTHCKTGLHLDAIRIYQLIKYFVTYFPPTYGECSLTYPYLIWSPWSNAFVKTMPSTSTRTTSRRWMRRPSAKSQRRRRSTCSGIPPRLNTRDPSALSRGNYQNFSTKSGVNGVDTKAWR